MKNLLLKFIVSLAVVLLVLYLGWRELVNPVFSGVAACFHIENEYLGEVYEQAVVLEDGEARRKLICQADVESVGSVRSCLRELKSQSILGEVLINDLPLLGLNTKKRVNFAVREHNAICPELRMAEERV